MSKEAKTNIEIHELIKKRWSPRAFKSTGVKPESILKILEAARWSASCFNEQPWRFIVGIKDENDSWLKIYNTLAEGNKIWCRNVLVLIMLISKKSFSHNGKNNRWSNYDLGQAAAYISLQALAENIYVHQMAGFDAKSAKENFQIPDDFEPKTIMALGYPGDSKILPDDLKKSELADRKRRSLKELAFSNVWENEADFLFK